MNKVNKNKNPDYQAYLDRLSAPPCPKKITEDEFKKIVAQKNQKRRMTN